MTDLRVLYRDERVIAVDKPAGVLTVQGRGTNEGEPLWARVRAIAENALPVHRLDRDTSGVQLFALGAEAQRALSISFEAHRAQKSYFALARGQLAETRCELPLIEARAGAMRVAERGEIGSKPSRTDFLPLEKFESYTWVLCRPHTGRTHQIRVHLAALGHALAIDPRYGEIAAPDLPLSRTPLHAASIRFPNPAGQGWLSIESPLPADLAAALEALRAGRRGLTPR